MSLLTNESKESYLVGGCVRDHLLGKKSKDYDIVTDVSMDRIEEIFSENGWKVDATGKQFLVMNVSKKVEVFKGFKNIKNGWGRTDSLVREYQEETHIYEIANFRKDIGSTDGRRPDKAEIGNIIDDAHRRDFTVNALYCNPFDDFIFAPVKGSKQDLEDRVLKFIGKPKDRIEEDYLRVFRFYRFLATKGFSADKKSMKACRELFNTAYEKTTPERVRNEIEAMI